MIRESKRSVGLPVRVRAGWIRSGEIGKIITCHLGYEVSCCSGCTTRFLVELESGEKRTYCGNGLEVSW